jgi:hypothetical protein
MICGLLLSFSLLIGNLVSFSYAQNIKTMTLQAKLEKKIVKTGDSQKIEYTAIDQQTNKPISGVEIRSVVTYPGGTLIKSIISITDLNGHSAISIPTNSNTPSDTVNVDATAFFVGYFDTFITFQFGLTSSNINTNGIHHHN